MNNLAGYDLVYAVSQQTINHQLELLSALSILPTEWKAELNKTHPDAPPRIDAQLGCPSISLLTSDDTVEVTFPLTSGTFSHFQLDLNNLDANGSPTTTSKTIDLTGASLVLKMNMDIAKVASDDIAHNIPVPDEVKNQLSSFNDSDFDINHLFLNFEDANLLETYQFNAPQNTDSNLNAPEVIEQVKNVLKSLFGGLKGTSNPFIMGYAVTNKTAPANDATFAPTGTNYSTFPDSANPSRSSINYLLLTNNHPIPGDGQSGVGFGSFTNNWITADDVEGTFVIAAPHVMDLIVPPVATALNTANVFGVGAEQSDFQSKDTSVVFSRPNTNGGTNTCTIQAVPNTNTMTANFNFTYDKSASDRAGTTVGTVNGSASGVSTITFNLDDAGHNITISFATPTIQQTENENRNVGGELEEAGAWFVDAIANRFANADSQDALEKMSHEDFHVNLNVNIVATVSSFHGKIILPAGKTFFYKDVRFSNEGHLMLTTTYKD